MGWIDTAKDLADLNEGIASRLPRAVEIPWDMTPIEFVTMAFRVLLLLNADRTTQLLFNKSSTEKRKKFCSNITSQNFKSEVRRLAEDDLTGYPPIMLGLLKTLREKDTFRGYDEVDPEDPWISFYQGVLGVKQEALAPTESVEELRQAEETTTEKSSTLPAVQPKLAPKDDWIDERPQLTVVPQTPSAQSAFLRLVARNSDDEEDGDETPSETQQDPPGFRPTGNAAYDKIVRDTWAKAAANLERPPAPTPTPAQANIVAPRNATPPVTAKPVIIPHEEVTTFGPTAEERLEEFKRQASTLPSRCPRCNGSMYAEQDWYGTCARCIACGHEVNAVSSSAPLLDLLIPDDDIDDIPRRERRRQPSHGKIRL